MCEGEVAVVVLVTRGDFGETVDRVGAECDGEEGVVVLQIEGDFGAVVEE